MRVVFIFIFCLIIDIGLYSQINTSSKFTQNRDIVSAPYDSTTNYVREKYYQYIGQTLYYPKSTFKSNYGIEGFNTKPKTGTTYKKIGSNQSKPEFIQGKYFLVTDTISRYAHDIHYIFLILKEEEKGDIIYYHYRPNSEHDSTFPFFVQGYFEKQQQNNIGKVFPIFHHTLVMKKYIDSDDYVTAKYRKGDYSTFNEWTCVDYYIEEGITPREMVILEDGENRKIDMSFSYLLEESKDVLKIDINVQHAIKKDKSFQNIKIGMSKLDVLNNSGSPIEVNKTELQHSIHEQWVYDNHYLYFEDDSLTAIQSK